MNEEQIKAKIDQVDESLTALFEKKGKLQSDLAALSESLEEFEVKAGSDKKTDHVLSANIDHDNEISITCTRNPLWFTLDNATEIYRNLGRLIATARKRKAAEK